MTKPTITACLLCDDVRKEINGKDILVGVYGGDVIAADFPAVLTLSLYVEIATGAGGERRMRVRISHESSVRVEWSGALSLPPDQVVGVGVPAAPVTCPQPGELRIDVAFDDEDWSEVRRKRVLRGPDAALTPGGSDRST
ncbi:MAG TPA: hypothetical protein VIL72_15005 [Beijerinckiaceae bacterium]|jgi:hypothetical protein